MTEPLNDDAAPGSYEDPRTGRTIRSSHLMGRATAANVATFARPPGRIRVGPMAVGLEQRVTFVPGADIHLLRLAWYYLGDVSAGTVAVDLEIHDDAGHMVASTDDRIPQAFKGASLRDRALPSGPSALAAIMPGGEGYLDLDALATTLSGSSWEMKFGAVGSLSIIERVEGWEVPRSAVDPARTYGVESGPFSPGRLVLAGSPYANGIGPARLMQTVTGARLSQRRYLQLAWPIDTGLALVPQRASATYGALTNFDEYGGAAMPLRVRVRPVWSTSSADGELARFRVLYKVTGGGTARVRVATGATGSPFESPTLTSSSWAWSDWSDCALPTNGADNVATVSFQAKTSAGIFYVAGVELDEATT